MQIIEEKMDKSTNESLPIYRNQQAYSTINGEAESPAGSAESAAEWEDPGNENGGKSRSKKGLGVFLGAIFLVGEMAGAGVLNLPKAIANTGWVGVPMMGVLSVAVGYSGTRLALCWVMLEERWPEYRVPCRRPYPAIAYRALGKIGQYITEVSLNLTLFGAATVYLLLTTQMISDLLVPYKTGLTQCEWLLINGGILIVPTWLGTPKDIWPASILAMTSTFVACIVVIVEVSLQRDTHDPPDYAAPTFGSFFLGFGSILFALGGASIFPTVQNDMKNRGEFSSSVVITFLTLMSIYGPMTIICYGTLGTAVAENVLMSVTGVAVTIAESFILCHFIFAYVIVINPVMQTMEGILVIPDRFGLARCVVRTLVMCVVVLIGLAVPTFGKILDLIGGSTVSLLSFVMPPLCYYKLSTAKRPSDGLPYRVINFKEKMYLFLIIFVGVTGGVASTWSALKEILSPAAFSGTCFSKGTFLK